MILAFMQVSASSGFRKLKMSIFLRMGRMCRASCHGWAFSVAAVNIKQLKLEKSRGRGRRL